ncbi:MAG: Ku protein [Acidobacteriota bacterium]|nr:Ku protein [Acidobacteriota bacterium]
MPEDEAESPENQSSLRPFWSGTITFGLVSIPVNLFPANRESRVPLRMLSEKGTPLARRYASSETGDELSAEQMVRGYEIEKGKFIEITDDELERLAPEKSRDIDLRRFVEHEAIPPMYFERSYFLAPAGGSSKAYRLLAETMEQTAKAGIATFVMRGKEYLVAIIAENGILRAETLRFSDEIRSPEEVGLPDPPKKASGKVGGFEKAIKKLSSDRVPEDELKDEAAKRLLELAHKKQARHEDVVETGAPSKGAEVIDIMSVLQRSLGQARAQTAQRSKAGAQAPRAGGKRKPAMAATKHA